MTSGLSYDEQVLEEIGLLGEVVSLANAACGPLRPAQIDAALQVVPAPRSAVE